MPGTARGRDPAVEEEFLGSLYKGGELLAAGKIVEAREHLEKAHELSPKNEKAQNLLGLAYFKLGLFDQAAHVYELLVRENPADPTLRVNLGLVYLKTNNLERAVREFETATDLEPGHKKAHNYLGLALAQQGEYGKAREHFVAAGSDQMAEKMEKAQSARSSQPSSPSLTVPSAPPATSLAMTNAPAVVVSRPSGVVPPPLPPPAAAVPVPPLAQEEAIEVMSDDELPPEEGVADVEVETAPVTVPTSRGSQPSLNSDWGAQLPATPLAQPADEEMRFAEDEGPASLPMNDAPLVAIDSPAEPVDVAVEPLPPTAGDMPMLDATAVEVDAQPAWLTGETAAEPVGGEMWVTETVADVPLTNPTPAPDVPPAPSEETWNTGASLPSDGWEPPQLEQVVVATEPPVEPIETIQDFQGAESLAQDPHWVAQPLSQAVVPEAYAEAVQQEPYQQAFDDPSAAVSEGAIEQYAEASASSTWEAVSEQTDPQTQLYELPGEAQSYQAVPEAQPYEQYEPPADALASEAPPYDEQPLEAQAQAAEQPVEAEAQAYQPAEAQPDEQSTEEAPYAEAQAYEPQPPHEQPAEIHHFEPPPPAEADASWEPAAQPAAEPAPIPLQLEHPYVPTVETADGVPDGTFAPMHTQRLVDLGATAGWVQQPDAGPFQLGPQGLAVTVTGEMLVRMTGLVAVVGSVQVSAEMRRKRGRPTHEPFGVGPAQVQRVKGNGVLYLEAGKSRFHSVDLTDQPGSSVDDEGAYLREELLFAFEEAVSFENGRLAADGNLAVDLVHLKGHGQVLLQLDGSLKAMAIPAGAPMVVPLHRLVGWFGRVTPRLMGFGGQGAVELTGDGFALLGTPST